MKDDAVISPVLCCAASVLNHTPSAEMHSVLKRAGFARLQYPVSEEHVHSALVVVFQTWIHMLVIVGSILSYFVFTLAFGAMCVTCNPPSNPYWIMQEHMLDPMFYLVCILTTCIALLPRYGIIFSSVKS